MDPDSLIAIVLLVLGLGSAGFGAAAQAVLPAGPFSRRLQNGERSPLEWVTRERSVLGLTALALSAGGIAVTCGAVARLVYGGVLPSWASLFGVAFVAAVLVWFVQAVPSAVVATIPERALPVIVLPLKLVHFLLTPLTALYRLLLRATVRVVPGARLRLRAGQEDLRFPEPRRRTIVGEIGEESADLEEETRDMIRGIIGMDTTTARMIMVPRMDIVAVEATAPPSEVADVIGRHGYSRIPIYEETIDTIVGIVYAKDLLRALHSKAVPPTLRALARTPYFVPESKRVDDLLREFRQERTHVAVIVDEYGGTAGLVTLEDLLEEIVGEIEDEYERGERAQRPIEQISDTEALLDARVSIEDLNELFETEIQHEGYETVGGLVYAHLGKIPNAGDQVHVNGLTISVVSTLGHRIKQVRAVHTAAGS